MNDDDNTPPLGERRGATAQDDHIARLRWLRKQHSRRAGTRASGAYADRALLPTTRGDDHASENEQH